MYGSVCVPTDCIADRYGIASGHSREHGLPPDDWGDPDDDYDGHYSDGYYSEEDHGYGLSANDGRDDYYED